LGATCGAVVGYNYKILLKGDLRSIGKLLIGSAIGAGAGLLLQSLVY